MNLQRTTNPACIIRFMFPDGNKIERRFYFSSLLKHVLNFIRGQGYTDQVHTNFPKRVVSTTDPASLGKTLKEMKFGKKEVLYVEEKHVEQK